ncbi:reverse transcriptase domain-containing protein [Tanacetum coccineum]
MGFPLKCFLDAYKGYHQVQMAEEDKEKIAFYTDQGIQARPTAGQEKAKTLSKELQEDGLGPYGLIDPSAKRKTLFVYLGHQKKQDLRRYFEAHPITVITDQSIKQVLNKADTSGRLAPYSVELAAYNITYEPRSAIKGQILANFINEVPVDGASSAKGSGIGLILINPTMTEYTYALRLNFESTNNQAEYEALLAGLRIAKKMGVQSLSVNVDSKLVASQINGNYKACKENMI